ncbi:unnamed protein product, partial [Rotaria sp. Silwood1]
LFVAINAPDHSAYNPIERRMAPLSHDLSGLILPHDYYGNHLDDNGKTNHIALEEQNFQRAGDVLAEVWCNTVIDTQAVIAEYISPSSNPNKPIDQNEQWKLKHVRQSQYCLQIVKCDDINCCGTLQTNLKSVLPKGFLPPPTPYEATNTEIPYVGQDKTIG